jgi:transcription-repair coupling factor (superfamily II helicase)
VISFRNDSFPNPLGLVKFIPTRPDWKIRPDQKLLVKGEWPDAPARLGAAEKIVKELARLAAEA